LEVLARLELRAIGEELSVPERLPHGVSIFAFSYALDASSSRLWEALQRRSESSLVVCRPGAVETASRRVHRLTELRQPTREASVRSEQGAQRG
jgi:hypothetical protein